MSNFNEQPNKAMSLADKLKIGFMGCGNMAQAIIKGWLETQTVDPSHILVSNRSEAKLKKVVETYGVVPKTNDELVEEAEVLILGMKPQDLPLALESSQSMFSPEQIIISLAAGVPISTLQRTISSSKKIIRVMPNTPIRIRRGVIGYCRSYEAAHLDSLVEDLFSPLGLVIGTEEGESFEALTVACSSGVGFVFELMQYWKEWLEEHDFDPKMAQAMTVQTFLGASELMDETEQTLIDQQSRVTSKKGVTWAGLDSMRELEVERALRYSFEKAVLRDRELGRGSK